VEIQKLYINISQPELPVYLSIHHQQKKTKFYRKKFDEKKYLALISNPVQFVAFEKY
jgi:competence transcription factor ComK